MKKKKKIINATRASVYFICLQHPLSICVETMNSLRQNVIGNIEHFQFLMEKNLVPEYFKYITVLFGVF